MGLWLGASVLAAVQMLDYCIAACHTRCCKGRGSCKRSVIQTKVIKVVPWDAPDTQTEKVSPWIIPGNK